MKHPDEKDPFWPTVWTGFALIALIIAGAAFYA